MKLFWSLSVSEPLCQAVEMRLRRLAYDLLWSKLDNLHGYAREKIKTGKVTRTLQAACLWFVSSAIVHWRRRNSQNKAIDDE